MDSYTSRPDSRHSPRNANSDRKSNSETVAEGALIGPDETFMVVPLDAIPLPIRRLTVYYEGEHQQLAGLPMLPAAEDEAVADNEGVV